MSLLEVLNRSVTWNSGGRVTGKSTYFQGNERIFPRRIFTEQKSDRSDFDDWAPVSVCGRAAFAFSFSTLDISGEIKLLFVLVAHLRWSYARGIIVDNVAAKRPNNDFVNRVPLCPPLVYLVIGFDFTVNICARARAPRHFFLLFFFFYFHRATWISIRWLL